MKSLRPSTLEDIGLGSVLDIFKKGSLPVDTDELVNKVFGKPGSRGCMVISGASGIVGAGKVMQFASRLFPYHIPIVALDMPGAPDGIGKQYKGLQRAFGKKGADDIMKNIIRLTYDGKSLPDSLATYNPKFLLEAIPEILEVKKAHYKLFRKEFPGIPIYSVTSGFPSSQLGVNIAHPAFPHEVNKIFEVVEAKPSDITKLLWSIGLLPIKVSDDWSFVLDVFFCGLMLAGLRFHSQTNTPYWKSDKYIRKLVGPNPFRAHDAIGAKGSNFLTWSCLHHLSKEYGPLFEPTPDLDERKDSGQNWYPLNHFRPMVNWEMNKEDEKTLQTIILGPLFQMTSILLKENRAHFTSMNALTELCAQFTSGIMAITRKSGEKNILRTVKDYHRLFPESAKTKWYPDEFKKLNKPEWQQLYVNAEHDNKAGVITISRESYNSDVDEELNRAMDWLLKNKIKRVILTSDFHLSTQMVGADTNEFFPALSDKKAGERIAKTWSVTARRLYNDFDISVGVINGKRCMGGMLELMMHCHYLLAEDNTILSMPEVTLPVVPGMEGCHWAVRKVKKKDRKHLIKMLMFGKPVKAKETKGWMVDYSGTMNSCLNKAWQIMQKGSSALTLRKVDPKPLGKFSFKEAGITSFSNMNEGQAAIFNCIQTSCNSTLEKALSVQAKLSAEFMISDACRKGSVGKEFSKVYSS